MADKAAGCLLIHSAAGSITFVLALADRPYLWISSLWMHEYESADACVRCHRVAFCHLDSERRAYELVIVCMAMLVCMAVSLAAAAAIVTVHLSAFSKEFKDVLLECVVRAA